MAAPVVAFFGGIVMVVGDVVDVDMIENEFVYIFFLFRTIRNKVEVRSGTGKEQNARREGEGEEAAGQRNL